MLRRIQICLNKHSKFITLIAVGCILSLLVGAATDTALAWGWPIKKEIPKELCGEYYQQIGEIVTDGKQKKVTEVPGGYVTIEPKRILRDNGEIMKVETVISVTKKGKTSYIVAFKGSSLSWLLTETDTPSRLAGIHDDKKDPERKKLFVLERRDAALPAKGKESTSAVREVNDWRIERLQKTGITPSHWRHPHHDEGRKLEWFRVQFSCSALPEDQDVWITSWVISEDKTLAASRSERSKKDSDTVELLFAVDEQYFDSSYVEILIRASDPDGRRQVSGYRFSLKRIVELEPEPGTNKTHQSERKPAR
ncbi:hypothetical protein ACFL1X_09145 [Candidatus Hydrogenedentota bacterium]